LQKRVMLASFDILPRAVSEMLVVEFQ
jgi:hypothetical protein